MSEELIQGSAAWLAIRAGKVTASRTADVCARTKTGYGASRGNYMAELLVERLTGNPAPSFINDAMRWGTENEPNARAAYEFMRDVYVSPVGFIPHPTIQNYGASPDGLVGSEGQIEVKCPNSATHIDTLLGEPIADKYIKQMQTQMACTGRAWCDWISFDPRMPANMQLFIRRVERDEKAIKAIEDEVQKFLLELEAKELALREKYGTKEAA